MSAAACPCRWCRAARVICPVIRATLSAALIVALFVITPVLATAGRAAAACGAGYVPEIHHTLTGLEEDEYWDTYCAPHGY